MNEDQINDFSKLKSVYDRVKPFIPTSKEAEPLLEIDRDEKKFEIFLSLHRNNLQVSESVSTWRCILITWKYVHFDRFYI